MKYSKITVKCFKYMKHVSKNQMPKIGLTAGMIGLVIFKYQDKQEPLVDLDPPV